MDILGLKPDHDGALAYLSGGKLAFSIENEKDSNLRQSPLSPNVLMKVAQKLDRAPDVFALSGWRRGWGAGYMGLQPGSRATQRWFGKSCEFFTSSHERSHILGAYGMSPYEQGRPCYMLTWEGTIGRFYKVEPDLTIVPFGNVLPHVGYRYAYAYYLASREPKRTDSMAGKMMALAAVNEPGPGSDAERVLMEAILNDTIPEDVESITLQFPRKPRWAHIPWVDGGLESSEFRCFARRLTDRIFDIYYRFASARLTEGLPLLIGGGCGLNCDWNTRWKNCGLFPDVFIPPCPNDAGSAIGTAIDAQFAYTGTAKIQWTVYAGEEFVEDCPPSAQWQLTEIDLEKVADALAGGEVVAWVQGKYEIGPRALGNRSLLAAPFDSRTTDRLNEIKQREGFRPVAPVCLAEDTSEHFDWSGESPHMLHFQKVKDRRLRAITHVDGSARVQTVSREDNPTLHRLLSTFKRKYGVGVLCNTSLNLKGTGFINRMSDLLRFCQERGISAWAVNDRMGRRRPAPNTA